MEFKRFCNTCNAERDILKITLDQAGETAELSCGHKDINIHIVDRVAVYDKIRTKHKDSQNKLLGKYKTEAAGETGYPARKTILIDREKQVKTHIVEEQLPNGEWIEVHHKETPFSEQKKKTMKRSSNQLNCPLRNRSEKIERKNHYKEKEMPNVCPLLLIAVKGTAPNIINDTDKEWAKCLKTECALYYDEGKGLGRCVFQKLVPR